MDNIALFRGHRRARRRMTDFFQTEWLALHEPALAELAKMRDLMTGETARVLMCMIAFVEDSNHIRMGAVHVAEELGIGANQAARAIRRLEEAGVLIKGRRFGWRLNPHYGYKGDPDKGLRRDKDGNLVLID